MIFRSADLDCLEKADPKNLNLSRVMARLWETAQFERARGRIEKAERAEALAMKLKKEART
jgi:hypothetical protein